MLLADVINRFKQKILVVCECFSTFVTAVLISDTKADTLRDGILVCVSNLVLPSGSVVRCDGDPSFHSTQRT